MASSAAVTSAVTGVASPGAMASMSAGSNVTVQPCGGVALRATPASGAEPVFRTSKRDRRGRSGSHVGIEPAIRRRDVERVAADDLDGQVRAGDLRAADRLHGDGVGAGRRVGRGLRRDLDLRRAPGVDDRRRGLGRAGGRASTVQPVGPGAWSANVCCWLVSLVSVRSKR